MDGREAPAGHRSQRIGRLLLCGLLAGCATLPGAGGPEDPTCVVEPPPRGDGGTTGGPVGWIGGTDPLDPRRAPVATSDLESLLFATLHPAPLRVDCQGRLRPSLARSWREEDGGRSWRLDTAGTEVDPGQATERARALAGRLREAAAWEGGVAPLSVELQPPSTVVVRFREPLPDGARTFALSRLAPLSPPSPGSWASGFGGWAAPRDEGGSGERFVVLSLRPGPPPGDQGDPSPAVAPSAAGSPAVEVRVRPGADPRAMLDAGAALLLTRDPGVVSWARRGSGVRVVPLPPDRAHLLAVPGGLSPLSGELRTELAAGIGAGAGPGGGAGADPGGGADPRPGPGDGMDPGGVPRCLSAPPEGTAPAAPPASRADRRPWIVHPSGDEVARALAERVAALAGPGGHRELRPLGEESGGAGVLRVVALEGAALEEDLRSGGAMAYVLPTPARSPAPCREWDILRARAPWISSPGTTHLLAETGAVALLRPGAPPLEVDGSGAVRILLPPSAP